MPYKLQAHHRIKVCICAHQDSLLCPKDKKSLELWPTSGHFSQQLVNNTMWEYQMKLGFSQWPLGKYIHCGTTTQSLSNSKLLRLGYRAVLKSCTKYKVSVWRERKNANLNPHLQKRSIQKHIFYPKVQYPQICHTPTGIYT